MRRSSACSLLAAALSACSVDSAAVQLAPDGVGQALIHPYYTARSLGNNPFNTYLSVVNTDSVGKVVRVRAREGRNGREVAGFNLFLAPGDMWAAAIVPDADGARLLTVDTSCTEPALVAFSNASYSGANADRYVRTITP